MNTALRTEESSNVPTAIKLTAAKRVTKELGTKSRSTSAKKKVVLSAKYSTPKRKVAGKIRSNGKGVSRKVKSSAVIDNPAEQVTPAPEPLVPAPDLFVQEDHSAISQPAAAETEFLTAEVASEPVHFEGQPEVKEALAAESTFGPELIEPAVASATIPAPEFIERDIAAESVPFPEFAVLNELIPSAENVSLCDDNAPASGDPVAEVARENPPTPLAKFWKSMAAQMTNLWNWAFAKFKSHQVRKRLRVCETVSLGEKRFLAVVQVDGEQFLVGGSSSSVSTLAHLERSRDFSDVFQRHCEQDLSQA